MILILLAPVVDASPAKEITTACTFLGVADNVGTDGAVKHISCEVGEEFLVESVLCHFVESIQEQTTIINNQISLSYISHNSLILTNYQETHFKEIESFCKDKSMSILPQTNLPDLPIAISKMELVQDDEPSSKHLLFMAQLTAKISSFLKGLSLQLDHSLDKYQEYEQIQGVQQGQTDCEPVKSFSNIADYRLLRAKGRRLKIDAEEERPKGPTSSFLIYYHDNKRDLAKKYGSANVSTLTKLASQEWKRLPREERDKYQRLSEQSKVRYQKEMEQYKQKYAGEIEKALKQRRVEYRANWMRKKQLKQALERGQYLTQYRSQSSDKLKVRQAADSVSSRDKLSI